MREAVIVASSRTPLAKSFRGSFNMTRPDDLAAHAIRDVLDKAAGARSRRVDDVILGLRQPHGPAGHNVARVAALRAGLPVTTAGLTVNRFCSSGLQAIVLAAHQILHEGVDAIIGGGVESITHDATRQLAEPVGRGAPPGVYMVMGDTAEVVAKRYKISREAQDEYSLSSQQRDRARTGQRLLRRRARADRCVAAPSSTRRAARRRARRSVTSTATSATGRTRRSRVSRSFRPFDPTSGTGA